MTAPRCILPGTTYLVTRRTTRRHMLMRPDADGAIQNIYWYVTAVVARECGITLHAVQMLSTHIHEVLTDTRGELPRFLQQRNRLFANALKCHRKWPEEVFSRGAPNCVVIYGASAALQEIGYTLANCVSAGLVARPEDWPGVSVVADGSQQKIRATRPTVYFDGWNPRWPDVAEIDLALPQVIADSHDTEAGAYRAVRGAIADAVDRARQALEATGRFFGKVEKLVRISHTAQASSDEPRRDRVPSFATAKISARTAEALRIKREFQLAYRAAFRRLCDGVAHATFPAGTWRLRTELHFPVAGMLEDESTGAPTLELAG